MKNYATGIQAHRNSNKGHGSNKSIFCKTWFEPAFETVNEGAKVAFLKLENLVIETYESDEATMKAGAIDHVAIDVKDIEETYKEVCAMDLNTMDDEIHFLPFWDNGVKFFTIKGPNEEKVEFSQFL